jgi:hypothetical protein
MKRVKMVRSGWRLAISTTLGSTLGSHGTNQSVGSANRHCMSTAM